MLEKMRKNKKGFTLVEVIVVLVILAILAAILVPSMIGWIDKAEQKTAVVEGRSMLLAAQTIVSENYKTYSGASAATALTEAHEGEAETLAEVGAEFSTGTVAVAGTQVTGFTMTSSNKNYTVTYTKADGFKVEKVKKA